MGVRYAPDRQKAREHEPTRDKVYSDRQAGVKVMKAVRIVLVAVAAAVLILLIVVGGITWIDSMVPVRERPTGGLTR